MRYSVDLKATGARHTHQANVDDSEKDIEEHLPGHTDPEIDTQDEETRSDYYQESRIHSMDTARWGEESELKAKIHRAEPDNRSDFPSSGANYYLDMEFEHYTRLVNEYSDNIVGPMPLDQFFEEFLPPATPEQPLSTHAFDDIRGSSGSKPQIVETLVREHVPFA